jgi:hypothetical protein
MSAANALVKDPALLILPSGVSATTKSATGAIIARLWVCDEWSKG